MNLNGGVIVVDLMQDIANTMVDLNTYRRTVITSASMLMILTDDTPLTDEFRRTFLIKMTILDPGISSSMLRHLAALDRLICLAIKTEPQGIFTKEQYELLGIAHTGYLRWEGAQTSQRLPSQN